jgi:hypothetical protein
MKKKRTERYVPTLKDYLLSCTPCIFLPTSEEAVALTKVKEAIAELEELGKETPDLGVWKITTGLRITAPGHSSFKQGPRDLMPSLQEIEKTQRPIIAVFYNLRSFMNMPAVIQTLVDTITAARLTYSTIVLAGPYLELAPELHDLVTYCECPLPTQKQLESQIKSFIDVYEDDIKLDGEDAGVLVAKAAIAASGLTSMAAENATALSLSIFGTLDITLIQEQKEQEIRKSDVLEYIPVREDMDMLGGFGELKDWLEKRRNVFTDKARDYGLPYPKGILLVGNAGSGKSLCSKVVASFLELPLLRMDVGRIFSSLVGSSESRCRAALKIAEAVSPCVVMLDEMEKGLAGFNSSGNLDSGVTARVVATILTWRQETKYPVFVVGTVNDPRSLPPMVYRKGRFDEIWAVGLPTYEERVEIFDIHISKRKRDPENFDLNQLALRSEDFSGAEIESCIEDAMFTAFSHDDELSTEYILESIASTNPQASINTEEAKLLKEWIDAHARPVSKKENEKVTTIRNLKRKGGLHARNTDNQ